MNEYLSAMMGTICCILFIAVVVGAIIISTLLTKTGYDKKEIEKLRRENGELWNELHSPFIKKLQEKGIEDGM